MKNNYAVDILAHHFPEVSAIQMRFNDLDGFAHVNNGVQQSYFDIGRANYLQRIYGKNFYTNENVLLVASYKTDFLRQITLTDSIEVRTSVYRLGNKSLNMIQVIFDTERNVACTVSESVMVAVNLMSGESITIPDSWRATIAQIERREF